MICSKCHEEKDETLFNWKIKGVKRSYICKECHRQYRREHYQANRQKYIDKARKWESDNGGKQCIRYGISPEKLSEMYAKFDAMCWLCKIRPAKVVDHDHSCCQNDNSCGNCIRGLLCSGCNIGIGNLGDTLDGLRSAVVYLEQYESHSAG